MPDDNENGESMAGMMTSKIREAARQVCKDEMKNCPQGIRHDSRIGNLEKEVGDVKVDIQTGFKEMRETYEKREQKREWTIGQLITVIGIVVMAISVIYDIFLKR
jgi:hypothetical protein